MSQVVHIIGCGRVGRTLARLWAEAGVFEIGQIVNRHSDSAREAVAFIGQGRPCDELGDISSRDWLMLGVPDSCLYTVTASLTRPAQTRPALAFHLSGSEPAELLRPLAASCAAVHPVRPFSNPENAVAGFAGTWAVCEGDAGALRRLMPCFSRIGARTLDFQPRAKRRYHAATIAASNFLNVLDELALGLAESAGLEHGQALELLVSLQRASLENIEHYGPLGALTGPIERGDEETCRQLKNAVQDVPASQRELFLTLARATAALAAQKKPESADALAAIGEMFSTAAASPLR